MSINIRPMYDTKLFTEIWDSADSFKTDFQASPFAGCIHYGEAKPSPETGNYDDDVSLLYYLLYARFANNPIANMDETQFKYKIYSVIFQYGPTWEKRLEIQDKLRKLTEEDMRLGSKAIYNSAMNPSTEPTTNTLEELTYINGQNVTKYKKSPMEAYGILWDLLNTDVTERFINRFRVCFKQFVAPEKHLWYISDDEEDENND